MDGGEKGAEEFRSCVRSAWEPIRPSSAVEENRDWKGGGSFKPRHCLFQGELCRLFASVKVKLVDPQLGRRMRYLPPMPRDL